MTALLLALAASVSWGAGDFLGGVGARRAPALTVLVLSQLAGLAALALVVAAAGAPFFGREGLAFAAAAGLGGVVGLGALYRGLAVGAMGVVAPISAAAAIVPVVYGLARGERPEELQLAGIAVVLGGVALVSRQPGGAGGPLAAGVGLALVAAAGFGWYFVAIDAAAARGPLWAVLVARAASCALALAVAGAVARRTLRRPRGLLPLVVAVGVLDVTANVCLAFALTQGYVSLVPVLASLYPVVTVALAFLFLRERLARIQGVGVAVALTGVALIAGG